MQRLTTALILIGALGLSGPALARDIYLQKQTPDQLKSVCAKEVGKLSQKTNGYDCWTDCHSKGGTACNVYCQPDKRCVAQVIAGRRPRTIESALQVPARDHR